MQYIDCVHRGGLYDFYRGSVQTVYSEALWAVCMWGQCVHWGSVYIEAACTHGQFVY